MNTALPRPAQALSIHYLRGVAAIMVVFNHIYSYGLVPVGDPDNVRWLKQGVAIFFVISGYVMVTSTAHGRITPGRFAVKRIERIVPLYWAVTLIYALPRPNFDPAWTLGSLLFVPTLDPLTGAVRSPVLEPGWTLNCEMAFYGLFALSMFLPRRPGLWSVIAVLVSLPLIAPLLDLPPVLAFYLQPALFEFAAGMLIAVLGLRAPGWCVPLGLAMLVLLPNLTDARMLAVTVPAALIVAGGLGAERLLKPWKLPVLLGDASYAIYLTHLFIVTSIYVAFGRFSSVIWLLPIAAASIWAGVLVHLHIEPQVDRLFKRLTRTAPVAWRRRFVASGGTGEVLEES